MEEQIKEMEAVIRDILNPYNDKDPEVEAWLLVTQEGWRKQQPSGKWRFAGDGIVECTACEEAYDNTMRPRNYCPNCGAYMKKE